MASIPTFDEVTPVAAMKTIVDLYKTGFLEPAPADKLQAKPSIAINNKVVIVQGDITQIECDAVVNAANESLLGGGGVDGAIHRAAGRGLVRECETLNGCRTGAAKITGGYRLPAKHVIHTVGPIYFRHREESPALLESCYRESLRVAVANGVRSVVFCCISTGIYGYPNDNAAHVACETVRRSLEEDASKLDKVVFCLFLPRDIKAYKTAAPYYFPDIPKEPAKNEEPAKDKELAKDEEPAKDEKPAKDEAPAKDEEAGVAKTSERGDTGGEETKDGEKPVAEETKAEEEEWVEVDKADATPATDTKTAAEGSDTKPETEAEKKD